MRHILVLLLLAIPATAQSGCNTALECRLQKHSAKGAVPAALLAKEIEIVAADVGLPPDALAALVLQESRGLANAYGPAGDHGLTQINTRTAIDLGLTVKCLYDWRCNLRAGARLFAQGRPCLYNLGRYRKLEGRYIDLCNEYETKLASFRY